MEAVIIILGLAVFLIIGMAMAASKLYKKAPSNRAFVRTGGKKAKVIIDGGSWVIPLIHEHRWVSLETMRIEVKRTDEDALITADKLRADVDAEFYIRVQADEQNVLMASRSLGARSVTESEVDALIAPKLISALRTVAAQKTLMELHHDRDAFASGVHQNIKDELSENGLLLETVTISDLDASQFRREDNYFDAQGIKQMTETVQEAARMKNEIERTTEEEIARKNVETRKKILLLDQEQKEAELNQELEINRFQIEQRRQIESETAEKQASQERVKIDQERMVEESNIQRKLAIENANIESEIKLVERRRDKDKVAEVAKVDIEKARVNAEIELVEQNRQKDIANAEAQSSVLLKEKERLEVAAQREKAEQEVFTVKQVEEARRAAEIEKIEAEVNAQKERIAREMDIQVNALRVQKEAQARFEASDLEAKAIERLAKAELEKAKTEAEGQRWLQEAKNRVGSNVLLQEFIQILPELTGTLSEALIAPIGKINDIKLIHMGGGGTGSNGNNHHASEGLGNTLLKSTLLYPILKEVADTSGIDLGHVMKAMMLKLGLPLQEAEAEVIKPNGEDSSEEILQEPVKAQKKIP